MKVTERGAQAALERANSLNRAQIRCKRTTERLRAAQADAKTATEKLEQGSSVSAWLVLLGRYKRKLAPLVKRWCQWCQRQ